MGEGGTKAKRGRSAGRVESDRGGCDAEAPAAPPPLLPAVPVAWFAGMPRERAIARASGELEKEWFDTFSTPYDPINTHHISPGATYLGGHSQLFLCIPSGPDTTLDLLRIPPTTLSSTSFLGYSRTPHTATDKNTPNDTDFQSNHQIANTTTFAFSQPRTTPTSALLGT
jgi:hypothetical protein